MVSTASVIRSAPAQASVLPVLERAHRELEDHDRKIGHRLVHVRIPELIVERGEEERRGLARHPATASSTPVMTPPRTALSVTISITFHIGAPSAIAASRRLLGTRRSMFSVVRTTTGMAISASAAEPAHPEKCWTRAT